MFARYPRLSPLLLSCAALLAMSAVSSREALADDPAGTNPAGTNPAATKSSDANAPASTAASADDIRRWAKDLDSDIYVKRQDAGRKLFDAGKDSIDPLTETAGGKSLESTTAAIDILHRLSQSADAPTRDAAKTALEKLAHGSRAAAANLATEALSQQSPSAQPNAPNFGPNIGGNIRFGGGIAVGPGGNIQLLPGGNFQLQPGGIGQLPGGNGQPIGGGNIQVFQLQANGVNGSRSVDVDDNGKKIHIDEDQNGIELRVTEKVNGQDKTQTYKAKDAAELKKKSPEAAKLYEQYSQNGAAGGIQIQAQIGGLPNFGAPFPPPQPIIHGVAPVPPAQKSSVKEIADKIDEARKLIGDATDNLKETLKKETSKKTEDLQNAIDKLDEATQRLDDAQRKLDR